MCILVVEAGISNPGQIEEITTPFKTFNLRGSKYDWAYKTTMIKRDDYEHIEKPNTRGTTIGGSSCVNYFTWILDPSRLSMIGRLLGHPLTEEIFSGEMEGLTHCVDTIYQGERQGSSLYLKNKPNVTILYGIQSKRLIIDPVTSVCSDVTVISNAYNTEINVYTSREVILSQGVFDAPKLLMLSGVGPATELAKDGIKPIAESPHVGQHLLDHPIVPFVLQIKDGFCLDDHILCPDTLNNSAIATYKRSKTGLIRSSLLELVGLPRIDERLEKYPVYRESKAANGRLDLFGPAGQPHFELDFVGMFSTAFQWHYPSPRRGTVTLNSANAQVLPNINLNFFGNERSQPCARVQTGFHPCGTARLSKNIHQCVVDPKLRVHGVRNLRIADASIIPVIPDCRIQNSMYMIGEKGADIIKSDNKYLYDAQSLVSS
ncbi:hypothetical protein N7532_007486 [Penicillium argentinense]|uniref:Glucose-methanol-choline oxidoreductase N-terminal domain-containing protein n=1 Tax=Penicillium argentinense TaxID=1131581 RepID=A0A9W9F7S6_9EURO|nr:uncharacterized protein N7532_007486 [Penicillium argentinense]KAJ5095195.1 hypothetical protein N7532_007486 [Penicillium argentinense]